MSDFRRGGGSNMTPKNRIKREGCQKWLKKIGHHLSMIPFTDENFVSCKGQIISKFLWCLQFPPKKTPKQVDLRFHSSKVEFVCSFFGGNIYLLEKIISTFSDLYQDLYNLNRNHSMIMIDNSRMILVCLQRSPIRQTRN